MKKTVADVAKERGVSERAIYKQIKTHSKALEGHIEKLEGKQWLDEYAVELLRKASGNSAPVVVEDASKRELEQLKAELEELKRERAADQRALRTATETMAELVKQHNEDATLIAESKLYIEQRDNAKKEADALHLENQALRSELEAERTRKLTWHERFLGKKEA